MIHNKLESKFTRTLLSFKQLTHPIKLRHYRLFAIFSWGRVMLNASSHGVE